MTLSCFEVGLCFLRQTHSDRKGAAGFMFDDHLPLSGQVSPKQMVYLFGV